MNLYWAQIPTADWGVFVFAPSGSRAITLAHDFELAEDAPRSDWRAEDARRSDWRAEALATVPETESQMEEIVPIPHGNAYKLIKAMGYEYDEENL